MSGGVSAAALGEVSARLTREFARLTGRGPQDAKSYMLDDRVLVTLLHGSLTRLEQTLVEESRQDVVRDVRLALEEAGDSTLARVVEEVTGREVLDYHSQLLTRADLLVEVFVLAG